MVSVVVVVVAFFAFAVTDLLAESVEIVYSLLPAKVVQYAIAALREFLESA